MIKYILSILLAIILVKVVKILFYNKDVIHGPDSNIIRSYIYKHNNKYYKFKPKVCICPTSISKS